MFLKILSKGPVKLKGELRLHPKNSASMSRWDESKLVYAIPADGKLNLADIRFEEIGCITIWPDSDHLCGWTDDLKRETTIEVLPATSKLVQHWKKVLGVSDSKNRGQGIRIGAIEGTFYGDDTLKHVRLKSPDWEPTEASEVPGDSPICHGTDVARIIAARAEEEDACGLAHDALTTLFMVEPTSNLQTYKASNVLTAAANALSLEPVDVLNVSLGVDVQTLSPPNRTAVQEAWNDLADLASARGTIIVAAAGNDSQSGVHLPAKCDDVVGVGGVGLSGLAKGQTAIAAAETLAKKKNGKRKRSLGTTEEGDEVFANLFHSCGKEIDCCAPSIGFGMKRADGTLVEFNGTSFAAPIVSGLLACRLSDEVGYCDKQSKQRALYARDVLQEMLTDLGISSEWQGQGFVRIKPCLKPILRQC